MKVYCLLVYSSDTLDQHSLRFICQRLVSVAIVTLSLAMKYMFEATNTLVHHVVNVKRHCNGGELIQQDKKHRQGSRNGRASVEHDFQKIHRLCQVSSEEHGKVANACQHANLEEQALSAADTVFQIKSLGHRVSSRF